MVGVLVAFMAPFYALAASGGGRSQFEDAMTSLGGENVLTPWLLAKIAGDLQPCRWRNNIGAPTGSP